MRSLQRRSLRLIPGFACLLLAAAVAVQEAAADVVVSFTARTHVEAGGRLLVPFRVQGPSSSTVLIRAVGKTLESMGVADAMQDPRLRLLDATGAELEKNDNWGSPAINRTTLRSLTTDVGAFPLPILARDAALGLTLRPGAYVAEITGTGAGTVLAEFHNVDAGRAGSMIRHLGILADAGSGNRSLIAGMMMTNSGEGPVAVRAVGPSLTVADPLPDPILTLFEGLEIRLVNDDWDSESLRSLFVQVGAFPLLTGSADAAFSMLPESGAMTLHVASNAVASGRVLLEVYEAVPDAAPPEDLLLLAPVGATVVVGEPHVLEVVALGPGPYMYQWFKDDDALTGATSPVLTLDSPQRADSGKYSVTVTGSNVELRSAPATVAVLAPPSILTQPQGRYAESGEKVTLKVSATTEYGEGELRYQWTKDGQAISGATSATLVLSSMSSSDAAEYRVRVANDIGTTTSDAATIRLAPQLAIGEALVVGYDIRHPNGNIYHQILLTGEVATVSASRGKVTRISFVDHNDDIVQVEFSGTGTLTLQLENATGPTGPVKYNQPGVDYMKGHAFLMIDNADETTNLSVFSVGRATAVNQTLFRDDETYDGVADVGLIVIQSSNGRFGGIFAGNARFSATVGVAGILATETAFDGPVRIGELRGEENAMALLSFGAVNEVYVSGGSLRQPNGGTIELEGTDRIVLGAGQTSQGVMLPAQVNKGRFDRANVEVIDASTATPTG